MQRVRAVRRQHATGSSSPRPGGAPSPAATRCRRRHRSRPPPATRPRRATSLDVPLTIAGESRRAASLQAARPGSTSAPSRVSRDPRARRSTPARPPSRKPFSRITFSRKTAPRVRRRRQAVESLARTSPIAANGSWITTSSDEPRLQALQIPPDRRSCRRCSRTSRARRSDPRPATRRSRAPPGRDRTATACSPRCRTPSCPCPAPLTAIDSVAVAGVRTCVEVAERAEPVDQDASSFRSMLPETLVLVISSPLPDSSPPGPSTAPHQLPPAVTDALARSGAVPLPRSRTPPLRSRPSPRPGC